jgi:type I restriction enzyme M protein
LGCRAVAAGKNQQEAILAALRTINSDKLFKNRVEFSKLLSKALKKAGLFVKTPLMKAILAGLSEKDETADICTDSKGNPESDPDLRDIEQIPFKEDIDEYIKREVLPYAPDAWVDKSKTKKGYEIPFTRYFYKYTELGNADETLRDIQALGAKIQTAISELFGEV